MTERIGHLDAAESAFVQRELEYVQTRAYMVRHPNLQMANGEIIPISYEMPPHTNVGTYRMYDMVGMAKLISDYADELPRADVKVTEHTWRARRGGGSYGYSYDEALAARANNRPLDQDKANAAKRAWDQLVDKIGTDGDATHGLVGFLGLSNTTSYVVPNGVSGFATWASKTSDEISDDISGIISNVGTVTNGVGMVTDLLLPLAQFKLIEKKRMGDGSDVSILSYVRGSNPGVNIRPWWKLAGKGAGGTDRMVAYNRSPDTIVWYHPEAWKQLPPEARNLETVVNCTGKVGSVVCRYPFEVSYGDGI